LTSEDHDARKESPERALLMVCSEVLGVDAPSGTAHFLDIGGFSMAAIQVAHQLRLDYGYELRPTALLRDDPLAEVARGMRPA